MFESIVLARNITTRGLACRMLEGDTIIQAVKITMHRSGESVGINAS